MVYKYVHLSSAGYLWLLKRAAPATMPTSGLEVLEKWKWKRVSVSEDKMGETGSCFHGAPSMVTWCTSTCTCQAPAISDRWSVLHQQQCQPVAWRYWKNGNGNGFLFPRKKWRKQDPVSVVLQVWWRGVQVHAPVKHRLSLIVKACCTSNDANQWPGGTEKIKSETGFCFQGKNGGNRILFPRCFEYGNVVYKYVHLSSAGYLW